MRSSKAPPGFYTEVDVEVWLQSGYQAQHSWTTPMGLQQVYHKAPKWVKEELQKRQIPGRTRITELTVTARYVKGSYDQR